MTIYSIGYQRLSLEELVSIMESKKVDLLVDVRTTPYSRTPDFNKNRLMKRLGKRYIWKGDILGGKEGPATAAGLLYLIREEKVNILMIMCMEYNPCSCHRFLDISRRLAREGVQVIHLFNGEEKTTDEMERLYYGK